MKCRCFPKALTRPAGSHARQVSPPNRAPALRPAGDETGALPAGAHGKATVSPAKKGAMGMNIPEETSEQLKAGSREPERDKEPDHLRCRATAVAAVRRCRTTMASGRWGLPHEYVLALIIPISFGNVCHNWVREKKVKCFCRSCLFLPLHHPSRGPAHNRCSINIWWLTQSEPINSLPE